MNATFVSLENSLYDAQPHSELHAFNNCLLLETYRFLLHMFQIINILFPSSGAWLLLTTKWRNFMARLFKIKLTLINIISS